MAESESDGGESQPTELGSSIIVVSDSSWEVLSDHRACGVDHELGTSWHHLSRPTSPPLDVPPLTRPSAWQHIPLAVDRIDDGVVALELFRELEGRSLHHLLPTEGGSDADTLKDFVVREPDRSSVTPPPQPAPECEIALKQFQESEGARLHGFPQCDPEARASLVAFLTAEGTDEPTAVMLADEMDGNEESNGLFRNEFGAWYRANEGLAGRQRRMNPSAEGYQAWAEFYHKEPRMDADTLLAALQQAPRLAPGTFIGPQLPESHPSLYRLAENALPAVSDVPLPASFPTKPEREFTDLDMDAINERADHDIASHLAGFWVEEVTLRSDELMEGKWRHEYMQDLDLFRLDDYAGRSRSEPPPTRTTRRRRHRRGNQAANLRRMEL